MLASIVLLGVIGDSDNEKDVQAKERHAPTADADSADGAAAGS